MRESTAVEMMETLSDKGAVISYSDPHVPRFPKMREHRFDLNSVPLTAEVLAAADCVLLATDHAKFDYEFIRQHSKLIVDCRGKYLQPYPNVVRA